MGRSGHAASVLHLAGISEHASGHARGGQAALLRAADAVVRGRCSSADSCVSTHTPCRALAACKECGGRVRDAAGQSLPQSVQKPVCKSAGVQ